jgi:hypothetical protein
MCFFLLQVANIVRPCYDYHYVREDGSEATKESETCPEKALARYQNIMIKATSTFLPLV